MTSVPEDQLFHELEQRYLSLSNEHELLLVDNRNTKEVLEKVRAEKDFLLCELETNNQQRTQLLAETGQHDVRLKTLSEENEAFRSKFSHVLGENERLKEDLLTQTRELSSLQSRYKEVQIQYSDAQSKELSQQFELSKVSRDRDLLVKQVARLEQEIQQIGSNERSKVFECNEKVREFELKATTLELDLAAKIKENTSLKDHLLLQQEKFDAQSRKIQTLESDLVLQKASSVKEVDALKHLVDLYKSSFEEATVKVSELEEQLSISVDQHNRALADAKRAMQDRVADYEANVAKEKEALLQRVSELEGRLEELQLGRMDSSLPPQATGFVTSGDLTVTQLYDRIVVLEKDVLDERRLRSEAELCLNRVMKDIEAKAPALAKQRRDYQRLVEYHAQLTSKLDHFIEENNALKAAVERLNSQLRTDDARRDLLEQRNADLAHQLQYLLRTSASQDPSAHLIEDDAPSNIPEDASELVSQRLVTYRDISELQERNMELLQIVRKLTDDASGGIVNNRREQEAIGPVLEELQQLQDARMRAEEMIAVLIQQRDMYKSMVDGDILPTLVSPGKPRLSIENTLAVQSNQETELKLSQASENNDRLKEQLARMKESDSLLHERLDSLREELTKSKLELAQASTEADFHRRRVDNLESTLKNSQQEAAAALSRRMEMERTLQEAHREIRQRDERIGDLQEQLRFSKDAYHRLEVELEVTKASEVRLVHQVSEIREEMKRSVSFAEQLHRIEQDLNDRAEHDRERVLREKEILENSYKTVKQQLDEKVLYEQQRIQSAEDSVRTLQAKLDNKSAEVGMLQESLSREKELLKASQERCALVERQLQKAQDRLASVHGAVFNDEALEKALAEKDVALEQARAEVALLQQQLSASAVHAEQYRKISIANESALKTLQDKVAESQASHQSELQEYAEALERAKQDLQEQRHRMSDVVNEIESLREKERTSSVTHADKMAQLQSELDVAKQEADQLKLQLATIHADIHKHQDAARAAFADYEHELQLHARAESELRKERLQLASLNEEIQKLRDKVTEQNLQCIKAEKVLNEEREKNLDELTSLRSQLEALQQTNDHLHSQIQSYSVQIEKAFDQKLANINSEGSLHVSTESTVEDIQGLKQASIETREVLRYMKREKEVLQAKVHVLESENTRYLGQLQSLQKTTDELRAELKKELDKHVGVRSEEEFKKLLAEVDHLNLVRESNSHLRAENEDLSKKVITLTKQLHDEQAKLAPIQDSLRKVSAEKEALDLVNDQLTNDVSYWKTRLHALVSRYNDVDPEEHRLLKTRLDEVTAALEDAKQQLANLGQSHLSALADKEKEIVAQKAIVENAEKSATTLRDKLRQFKSRIEDLEGKNRELLKSSSGKDVQLAALQSQLQDSHSKIDGLTIEVDDLKKQISVPAPAPIPAPVPAVAAPATPIEPESAKHRVEEAAPIAVEETLAAPLDKPQTASLDKPQTASLDKPQTEEGETKGLVTEGAIKSPPVPSLNRMKQSLLKKQNAARAAKVPVADAPASTEISVENSDEPAAKKSRTESSSSSGDVAMEVTEEKPTPIEAELTDAAPVPGVVSAPPVLEEPSEEFSMAESYDDSHNDEKAKEVAGAFSNDPPFVAASASVPAVAAKDPVFNSSFGIKATPSLFGSTVTSAIGGFGSLSSSSAGGNSSAVFGAGWTGLNNTGLNNTPSSDSTKEGEPPLNAQISPAKPLTNPFSFAPLAQTKSLFGSSSLFGGLKSGPTFGSASLQNSIPNAINPWKTSSSVPAEGSTAPVCPSDEIVERNEEPIVEESNETPVEGEAESSVLEDEGNNMPKEASSSAPTKQPPKKLDPVKKLELRAARFSQSGTQPPAPGPVAAPGRGKKRPGRGLKGAATAVAASSTSAQQPQDDAPAQAGGVSIEEGSAE
eukprot:gene2590-2832_t